MNTCVAAAKHIHCTDNVVVQHGILEAGVQSIQTPFSPARNEPGGVPGQTTGIEGDAIWGRAWVRLMSSG